MEFIKTLFQIGFNAYQLESPFFGLTFWDIAIGVFTISIAIGVFRAFFSMKINSRTNGWQDKEYKSKNDN